MIMIMIMTDSDDDLVGDEDTCLKKEFKMFRFDFTQKCFVLVTRQGERFVKKKRNLM